VLRKGGRRGVSLTWGEEAQRAVVRSLAGVYVRQKRLSIRTRAVRLAPNTWVEKKPLESVGQPL